MPELSTTPDKAITLETVSVKAVIKKHGKLLTVIAIVVISFVAIYYLTKSKPSINA